MLGGYPLGAFPLGGNPPASSASSGSGRSFKRHSAGCGCCGCKCCRRCQEDTPCTMTLTTSDGLSVTAIQRSLCSWFNRYASTFSYLGNSYDYIIFSIDGSNKLYLTIQNTTTGDTITWRTAAAVTTGAGIWDCTANYTLVYDTYAVTPPSSTPGNVTATPSAFQDCAPGSGRCHCNSCFVEPTRWKVVISHVINRIALICADCTSLNGTYYLDACGYNNPLCTGIDGCCEWTIALSPSICGYDSINLLAGMNSYSVDFIDTAGVIGPLSWERYFSPAAQHDCMITDYELFEAGALAMCKRDGTTPSCLITAIP